MDDGLLIRLAKLRAVMARSARRLDLDDLSAEYRQTSVPVEDLQELVFFFLQTLGPACGEYFVPAVLLDAVSCLLHGRSVTTACDPYAGFGVLAANVHAATNARTMLACERKEPSLNLGRVLAPQLEWQLADGIAFVESISEPLDVVASVLPFGMRTPASVALRDSMGLPPQCAGDLGQMALAAASLKLSPDGVGLFVVPMGFFRDRASIAPHMSQLGLRLEAALELPAQSFAPYTKLATCLLVVRKGESDQMFVAELSRDSRTNRQVVANLREGRVDGPLELGRIVNLREFAGLSQIRISEKFRESSVRSGISSVRLCDIADAINLGRSGGHFEFSNAENSIYIPLIGLSDVLDSSADLRLKPQNYAQVVVNRRQSDARFVARFLNSELGREAREANKSGTTIRKLTKSSLDGIAVLVPPLESQEETLRLEAKAENAHSTILGLQNDLASLRRELWSIPVEFAGVDVALTALSQRLSGAGATEGASSLEQWFEMLPFPLASILRAWQATASDDYKTRYEHLLHFFEACAEFFGLILLSAFSSDKELFRVHRNKLTAAWSKQSLSLERATFGTWRTAIEYLGRQTRELVEGDVESRSLCAGLFADPTLELPHVLSRQGLAAVLSAGNKNRNDWVGHGGIVGKADAQLRNEKLLSEIQNLRDVVGDSWKRLQMVQCVHCKPRSGRFENEIAILMGSNSEFLKETRPMSSWLDVDALYLLPRDSDKGLRLLPLMHVGPSPASARNACYFFNRVDKDGIRFVSYHFVDQPERKDHFEEASKAIKLLTETEVGAS